MVKRIRYLSIFFCSFLYLSGNAGPYPSKQTIYYTLQRQNINVLGETEGYTSDILVRGFNEAGAENSIHILYGQLEIIDNINASYYGDNGKDIRIKKNDLLNHTVLTSSFYSDLRSVSFNLPKQSAKYGFQYSYTSGSEMLMYLTSINLNDYTRTDTFQYLLHVPAGLCLLYRIYGDTTTLKNFTITKTAGKNEEVWEILSLPDHPMKRRDSEQGTFSAQPAPVMQLLILPVAERDNPELYFNNWYLNLIEPHSHLSDESFHEITASVENLKEDNKVISGIFETIQKKVHYISVEDGIRAFQPKDVNEVWKQKQGDCKDMANLLCQTLRKLNYDARVAVSSTVSHPTDFVFPSLSSGNHCICVVKINGDWKYLDATDDECEFGLPSRHTQGRNIFIVGKNGSELHRISEVPAEYNKVFFNASLEQIPGGMKGTAEIDFYNMSKYRYSSALAYLPEPDAREAIRKDLDSQTKNLKYENLSITRDSILRLQASINTSKNFTSLGDKEYLSLSFLPFPHPYTGKIDSSEKLILDYTVNTFVDFTITLTREAELKGSEPVTFEADGFHFQFAVTQAGPKTIHIHYQCMIPHIAIENENREVYNELNELILKTFSKPVAYAFR